ncbi:MAG: hypothetical protein L6R41_005445 [Letrouitia leprolyta]|nr:MAG: hypothetical protein L6R41_005445 [Letrouitia leprolyta]
MIGTSWWQYILIRTCIAGFRYVVPVAALICILSLALGSPSRSIPIVIIVWAACETFFLFFVFVPRYFLLQRQTVHPAPLPRDERQKIFRLCLESVSDPEQYISKWFKGAPLTEIRRDNVKQFFCWSFLNKENYGLLDDQELEDYTDQLETKLGRKLQPGMGNATALRLTLDKVQMLFRPLIWYIVSQAYSLSFFKKLTVPHQIIAVVDAATHVYMRYQSFHFYRLSLDRFLIVFPPRPLTLLTTYTSPAKTLSYWHRPHKSKAQLPVLLIHGIGIGHYTYAGFLAEINRTQDHQKDGETGIIALEIMPISFRITHAALRQDEMREEIMNIVQSHGWTKFVLVAHSYGSVIVTHLLKSPESSSMIEATVLIDPVSILLHLPDVAYNFTCRQPVAANEHQLYYFASMDMGVAHTLSRSFFWQENILWKHELQGRRVTVSLCGRDIIVNTEAVGRYLQGDRDRGSTDSSWKRGQWERDGLNIVWFEELDHGQVFEKKRNYERLIKVIQEYISTTASVNITPAT